MYMAYLGGGEEGIMANIEVSKEYVYLWLALDESFDSYLIE